MSNSQQPSQHIEQVTRTLVLEGERFTRELEPRDVAADPVSPLDSYDQDIDFHYQNEALQIVPPPRQALRRTLGTLASLYAGYLPISISDVDTSSKVMVGILAFGAGIALSEGSLFTRRREAAAITMRAARRMVVLRNNTRITATSDHPL